LTRNADLGIVGDQRESGEIGSTRMGMSKEQARVYHRSYYYKRRQKLYDFLGGKCVVCGATEDLEFDHIDPAQKSFDLKDNLTLALKAKSIRIQAPIPGLGLVGVEVPNEKRDIVGIKEVLRDDAFTHHKSKLALALGKDINGDFIVGDLAKMPHLLIAGQTGSGKSV
jgi:hypothetical protein